LEGIRMFVVTDPAPLVPTIPSAPVGLSLSGLGASVGGGNLVVRGVDLPEN